MTTLKEQALDYARRRVPVFPIERNGKQPLTPNGFYAATCNAEKIKIWWDKWPDANIGTPTGYVSDDFQTIDVLDIDVRPEGNGFSLYYEIKEAGFVNNCYAVIETPSGGMHVYFKGSKQSSGSLRGRYVDFKATGGYVLLPPSVVNGKPYEVKWQNPLAEISGAAGTVDWIAVQQEFAPTAVFENGKEVVTSDYQMEYLAAYLEKQTTGNRNNALHWATCRALEAGYLKNDFDPLVNAALKIGLEPEEIAATINSARRNVGVQNVYRTRSSGR